MSTESLSRPLVPWMAVGLALPVLLASLGVSIANIALPAIAADFAAPMAAGQWVVAAYLLAITVSIVPAGYAGDRFGRKRVLLGGIFVYTAASLACALAPSLTVLAAARAIQGVGAAVLTALAMPLIRDVSRDGSLGAGMGLLGSMSAVGTALGPFVGGMIVAGLGWPAVFMALVPPGLASLLLLWRMLPDEAAERPVPDGRFDFAGAVVLAIALTAYTLSWSGTAATGEALRWLIPAVALAGAGAFVLVESRSRQPLVRLSSLLDPAFSAGLAANVLVSVLMMTTLAVGPFYLMSGLGLGAAEAGMVMALGPLAAMLTGVLAGPLTDRIGTGAATVAGLVQVMAGGFGLAVLPLEIGVAGYMLALVVLAPGYQLFLAANNAAVMAGSAAVERGAISGLLNLSRNLGFVTGASAMAAFYAAMLDGPAGAAASPETVALAASRTFAVAGALIAAAILITLAGRRAARLGR